MAPTRLRGLIAAAAITVLSLSACSTGPAGGGTEAAGNNEAGSADAFPVTIEHVYGETVIEEKPERVATVSWVNADVSLALGVVPVGMPLDEYGQNENGSTPWKDAKLEELGAPIGSENAPVQYSELDGIAFDEIAATNPDVILAVYSGITEEDYQTLSEIAPVIAYPEMPFGTAWQDSTRIIGEALGLSEKAEEVVTETETAIEEASAEYPAFEGKTFIWGNLAPQGPEPIGIYASGDNRPRFLTQLGMVEADVVTENLDAAGGSFYFPWAAERANELESDIFVTSVDSEEVATAIAEDPLLSQIPAVENGTLVADTNPTRTLSLSAANPISLIWALDEWLPMLNEAAEAAEQ
ncbi:iron complex transport system substrate-binding protein [Arthrobacter pigmenti]|uniref:Iron complex transport system substrate-binding protein n=1 Tax=Arthrobacter pigmenti TaxID=271432 RepID=A0A846RSW2_9MICC|nr:iron-siderophore ABC transporter substrate-binding protein [Arthrobacter pigmenti]NJC23574.1 iron complex transport system substrate-binding protein [Arthrobacter pigmenti]